MAELLFCLTQHPAIHPEAGVCSCTVVSCLQQARRSTCLILHLQLPALLYFCTQCPAMPVCPLSAQTNCSYMEGLTEWTLIKRSGGGTAAGWRAGRLEGGPAEWINEGWARPGKGGLGGKRRHAFLRFGSLRVQRLKLCYHVKLGIDIRVRIRLLLCWLAAPHRSDSCWLGSARCWHAMKSRTGQGKGSGGGVGSAWHRGDKGNKNRVTALGTRLQGVTFTYCFGTAGGQ